MDIVFVLDVSLSIENEENLQLMKNFVTSLIGFLNISPTCSRAAVILFARDAWINFTLSDHTDVANLRNAIDQIRYNEISRYNHTRTNTPAALNLLRTAAHDGTLGIRDDVVHVALIITKGKPNIKHLGVPNDQATQVTEAAAKTLHQSGIYNQVYAIGIGTTRQLGNTLEIIANPSSLVFPIAGFDPELFEQLVLNVTGEFCDRK